MAEHSYIEVGLEFDSNRQDDEDIEVTSDELRATIEESYLEFYGDEGGLAQFEIVGVDKPQKRAVVRVPDHHATRIRTAITFVEAYKGIPCNFVFRNISKEPITFEN